MENMEKRDEKNIIIICSIAGSAILLIIIVSICFAKAVSRLKHTEKEKLKLAEEGKAQSSDENESTE
ncbi:hypothetical protein XELAEV_18000097mg [Xenopus laevis]|uniref:Uncharacterized protein n=1 Tax=Xenopus laevis TaxID=8355 RepID=A0A974GZL7_XENLA|nr:hypothetical protein XELAEV_18000097mg [Xenopus laevis]